MFVYLCIQVLSALMYLYVRVHFFHLWIYVFLCLTYRAMKVLLQMSLKENTLVNYILISYGVSEAFSLK